MLACAGRLPCVCHLARRLLRQRLHAQGVWHHGRELERVLSQRYAVEATFWDAPYNATDPARDGSLYIMLTPHLARDFPPHYILWQVGAGRGCLLLGPRAGRLLP